MLLLGVDARYLSHLCDELNRECMQHDTEEDRKLFYQLLVKDTKERVVPGWELVRRHEDGVQWVKVKETIISGVANLRNKKAYPETDTTMLASSETDNDNNPKVR